MFRLSIYQILNLLFPCFSIKIKLKSNNFTKIKKTYNHSYMWNTISYLFCDIRAQFRIVHIVITKLFIRICIYINYKKYIYR